MLRVLNPTTTAARQRGALAPRLDTLRGKSIGVLWNSRAMGDKILSFALELLQAKHGLSDVVFRSKPYVGNIAPAEVFKDLVAHRIDAAITGVGD